MIATGAFGNRPSKAALAGTNVTKSKENRLNQTNNPSPRSIWPIILWWEPQAPPITTKLIR
jgi:hypothetical protein